MSKVVVEVSRFRDGAKIPSRSTMQAAGFDVYAWVGEEGKVTSIEPGKSAVIKTGLNLRIPVGYEVQVRSRSGLAAKNQIAVLNSPGTVDADYTGQGDKFELGVILVNHSDKRFAITHGDRIAQVVVNKLPDVEFLEVDGEEFRDNASNRQGGFGSTGVQ